jgi:hypothetical protein
MTVLQSGLLMAPASFVMLVCGPLAGLLGNRIGFRAVLAAGTIANAISFAILAVAHDTTAQFIASNLILGVGISFGFRVDGEPHRRLVDPSEVGVATGITRSCGPSAARSAPPSWTALLNRRHDRRLEHPDRATPTPRRSRSRSSSACSRCSPRCGSRARGGRVPRLRRGPQAAGSATA